MNREPEAGDALLRVHNMRGAISGLSTAVKLLQSGYRFDDERGAEMIEEMGKAVRLLQGAVQEISDHLLAPQIGTPKSQEVLSGLMGAAKGTDASISVHD